MTPKKKQDKTDTFAQASNNASPTENEAADRDVRRARFIKELLGIFLGISLAMMISSVVPSIRQQYSLGIVVLWGGALGGLLTSFDRFEQAGAALTRGENKPLNYIIGISLPLLILGAFYLLSR